MSSTSSPNLEGNSRKTSRIDSIDVLRGLVMIWMMLDHTRDFVHFSAFTVNPTDLTQTNTALFLTRWITHFCAPVFVFLAGTSIYLQLTRGKSKGSLSKFLLTRGLWLIVLEFTVVRFGVCFNLDYSFLAGLQVIWVIGVSMILMAGLIHLPLLINAAIGLILIAGHNLLDGVQVTSWRGPGTPVPSFFEKLWIVLHQPFEAFPLLGDRVLFLVYPLVPWVGVMAVGYAFGWVYRQDAARRRKLLLLLGATTIALFVLVRFTNLYGDPSPWARQQGVGFTILSFVNTTKYPPSLLFLLMTLGPAFLVLVLFEQAGVGNGLLGRLRDALVTFGRVPLFFYLLQWPAAHLISIGVHAAVGKPVRWLFRNPLDFENVPANIGFDLWAVYACWLVGVALLYPLCKWFAGVKQRRKDWWLSYL
jgi:uncharacterized membrane protein